jgi:hypothetical protein
VRVLNIESDISAKLDLPKGTEIVEIKLNDYLNTTYEEKFDMIVCVHALQRLWPHQLGDAFKKLTHDLKDMGELHIHVPATDIACKALTKSQADPASLYMIWGNVDKPFHCGFTMLWLRAMLQEIEGVIIRDANAALYRVQYQDQERKIPEYVVVATIRRD